MSRDLRLRALLVPSRDEGEQWVRLRYDYHNGRTPVGKEMDLLRAQLMLAPECVLVDVGHKTYCLRDAAGKSLGWWYMSGQLGGTGDG